MVQTHPSMSYQYDYISKNHPTHRWVYLDHLEQFGISLRNFENILLNVPCFPYWAILCEFGMGFKHFEQVSRNSVKNSVFSRLCPTSLIKFPKIFHLIYWQFGTIWNSLEPFPKVLNKFGGIPFKILCFPENGAMWKISLRIRYDSYIGIFRPFGTSEGFEKSSAEGSAEDSVIPCFPESVSPHCYAWFNVGGNCLKK